jgi:hypothetical protein
VSLTNAANEMKIIKACSASEKADDCVTQIEIEGSE